MSFAKSKNDFSKKDMNFFSEFSSATSQQISSAFPIFLLATVAILAITLIVWIVCGIQIMNKQNKINDIKKEMNSAEYQRQLAKKDESQVEVERLRAYYYEISTLDSKVASKTVAASTTLTTCKDCMPNDTVMTAYDNLDGVVTISGQSINRESALNYLHLLEEKGLFAAIEDSIKPFDPIELGYKKNDLWFGNMNYSFTFTCTLKGYVTLTYASFIDGATPTPLSVLSTEHFNVGSDYTLPNIATYSQDGVEYKLTNVKINGTAVTPERLTEIINKNELGGKISGNTNIELMYTANNGGES